MIGFKAWKKQGDTSYASTGGWLGVTDKYWLAAHRPRARPPRSMRAQFRADQVNGVNVFEADDGGSGADAGARRERTAPPSTSSPAPSGSRCWPPIEKALAIPRFDDAVDWGHFWFITRPIFWLLETIHGYVGNFGLSILLLTLVLRGAMFPLANKSYESMSKMKKLQPEIAAIKAKNDKEPQKVQQETMQLYQREGINPLMGCLPLLVQIPIFFSLYKVLYVTIEMRHAPFFGWINGTCRRRIRRPSSTCSACCRSIPAPVPLIGSIARRPAAHRRLSDPLRRDHVAEPADEPPGLHRSDPENAASSDAC